MKERQTDMTHWIDNGTMGMSNYHFWPYVLTSQIRKKIITLAIIKN